MRQLRTALVLVALTSSMATAQGLGLAVGTLVPQGELADGAKTGFAGIVSVELPLSSRFGLRAEALWANSDLDGAVIKGAGGAELPASAEVSGDVKLVGGLGSVVVNLGEGFLRPYLVGGAGYYNRSVTQNASGAVAELRNLSRDESSLGFHAGVGLRLSVLGFTAFGEARYHTVNTGDTKTNFVPLLVGIRL
jgi:hypothetical protein